MKPGPLVVLALLMLAAAGCESVSQTAESVRAKIGASEPEHLRTFPRPRREVYDAVREAAGQMGYRVTRGGPAQGVVEAVSGVMAGETRSSARQIAMAVQLRDTLDGKGTEVKVRLTEIIEADSSNRAGHATGAPLRDTPQYDVFFQRVGRVLGVAPETK
jgi:hypothetical protein